MFEAIGCTNLGQVKQARRNLRNLALAVKRLASAALSIAEWGGVRSRIEAQPN